MKRERIEHLVDSFVDENGEKRYFVIAAISEVFDNDDEPCIVSDGYGYEIQNVVKGLKIGYSICNPVDNYNEQLGIDIAIGRARKNSEYALLASNIGYIHSRLVKAVLQQEAEYFKRNPASKIKGYKRKND